MIYLPVNPTTHHAVNQIGATHAVKRKKSSSSYASEQALKNRVSAYTNKTAAQKVDYDIKASR